MDRHLLTIVLQYACHHVGVPRAAFFSGLSLADFGETKVSNDAETDLVAAGSDAALCRKDPSHNCPGPRLPRTGVATQRYEPSEHYER